MKNISTPSVDLLKAFKTPKRKNHVKDLVSKGHVNDAIFSLFKWNNNSHSNVPHILGQLKHYSVSLDILLEALNAGHPYPQKDDQRVQLAGILAYAPKPYHDQVLHFFERMAKRKLVQPPASPWKGQEALDGDDTLLTFFSVAAFSGNLPLMKKIVAYADGAEHLLKAKLVDSLWSPFAFALAGKQKEIFEWLLTQFAPHDWPHECHLDDPRIKAPHSLFNTLIACRHDLSWFEYIFNQGERFENTPILPEAVVAYLNHPNEKNYPIKPMIDWLVGHGAPLETPTRSALKNIASQLPFWLGGETFAYLIAKGADIHWQHQNYFIPLFDSCLTQDAYFHCLVQHGLDLESTSKDGETPLFMSVRRGYKQLQPVSRWLIEQGVNLNVVNHQGLTLESFIPQADQVWFQEMKVKHQVQQLEQQTPHVGASSKNRRRL